MSNPIVVIDYKSGFVAWEQQLQLGGYALLVKENYGYKPDGALLVKTTKDGTKVVVALNQEALERKSEAFLKALAIYQEMAEETELPSPDRYYHPTTKAPYVSVTEVIKYIIAKPALLKWMYDMGKSGKDAEGFKNERGEVGRAIHHRILTYLRGDTITFDEDTEPLQALKHFMVWEQHAKLHPIHLEEKLFHPTLGFAGTPDFVGRCHPALLEVNPWMTGKVSSVAPAVTTAPAVV